MKDVSPIHAIEAVAAGLFAYRAYSDLRKASAVRETTRLLQRQASPVDPTLIVLNEEAADSLQRSALLNGVVAAGVVGLIVWSWDDPNKPLARLRR